MDERIKYWLDTAEYDMDTADAMFETKRYLYVGFMCHLIVEKLLKAYYVKALDKTPPYSHNLRLLAHESGLKDILDEEKLMFIISLQPFNIEARYPSYKDGLQKKLNNEICYQILSKTKELFQWIKQIL